MNPAQLHKELTEAKRIIEEQQEYINNVSAAAITFATIVWQDGARCVLSSGGKHYLANAANGYKVGDVVTVHPESGQIVAKAPHPPLGLRTSVIEVSEGLALVEVGHSQVYAYTGHHKVKEGDNILLDPAAGVVLKNFGQPEVKPPQTQPIAWEDVGGLTKAKAALVEAVVLPQERPEIFKYYNKKPIKGVLLYGPPGCGKTMLGKAVATAVAAAAKKTKATPGFLYVKGPEVLTMWVGESERKVREMFEHARAHKEKHGTPCVIFIDEADALLGRRGGSARRVSGMEDTVVPAFLAEMDGLEDSAAVVILATNRPDSLDEAVVRDGRVDRRIKVERPDLATAAEIFMLNLKNVPIAKEQSAEGLAAEAATALYAPHRVLGRVGQRELCVHHTVNGGMIAGIVAQATSFAMIRDLKANKKGGVCMQDMLDAVEEVARQQRDIDHTSAVEELSEA
jgi:proteasome ATPase